MVTLGRYLPGLPVHSVRGDEQDAGAKAAELVLAGGGKRFGLVDGPSNLTTIVERKASVVAHLEAAVGPGAIRIEDGDLTYAGGYRAALALMDTPDRPDTLIGLTDIMALGAMDAVRHELGLKVPDDVAVVGFDDIPEAGHMSYQLSTIRTPVKEMVAHMIELISPGRRSRPSPAPSRSRRSWSSGRRPGASSPHVSDLGARSPPRSIAPRQSP